MADDAQQKQIALSLRQTNTISDQTTIEELGFDYEREAERKREELKQRNAELVENMRSNAEAQGLAFQIQTKYQMKAQAAQSDGQPPQIPQGLRGMGKLSSYDEKFDFKQPKMTAMAPLMDAQVENFLKGPGDSNFKRMQLATMRKESPDLYLAVRERLRLIKSQANDKYMRPLPEQNAPTRSNSPV
jgi:hypothetical protein